MLFFHIPMPEYVTLYNEYPFYGQCSNVSCWSVNTGLFAAIIEQPTVNWVSVGHNHGSDSYGAYQGVILGFGRKTGYGGTSSSRLKKGARVFEITLEPYSIDTWIR